MKSSAKSGQYLQPNNPEDDKREAMANRRPRSLRELKHVVENDFPDVDDDDDDDDFGADVLNENQRLKLAARARRTV